MGSILSRMLWFFVVASLLSYATYLVVGNIAHAQASGENLPTLIRDELGKGVHHLSGMVMVPTPCDQLSVRTEAVSNHTFVLVFRTWREPSVNCPAEETPRYFRALLFAPSTGVEFAATLDGAGFPVVVLPALPGHSILE
ncbi:hypothetical protein EXS56_00990 [Candidatus Kaiserbacteria bacterium]|nr:hypothetical protein [Candidatus Kaiserbacteria bacterium]